MTLREFSGWTPTETQHHFDADGNPTGSTIIVRESRIDDIDRAELLALARFESEVCQCGYHPLLAEDKANNFTPETHVCPVCAAQAVWNRVLQAEEKSVPPDASPMSSRPSDGRRSYMRMLPPVTEGR